MGVKAIIHFKKITFKNFLSFGNIPTEIQLDGNQTTVIVGRNGAGKSTMLDAITFVLYGKPYRNINKPQLVNSVNTRDCLVEIFFSVGKIDYHIKRGIKPNIFEIYENGKLIDQESRVTDYQDYLEKNILKMNYTAFTQIVVLGKATYVPFMRLRPAERRSLIEELLGLTIFSKMNEVLKGRLSSAKNEKSTIDNTIHLTEEKIDMRNKYITKLSTAEKAKKTSIENDIEAINKVIDAEEERIAKLQLSKEMLLEQGKKFKVTQNKQKQLTNLEYEFKNKMKRMKKNLDFFEQNDVCPTCNQDIDPEFKSTKIDEYKDSLSDVIADAVLLKKELDNVNEKINVFEELFDKIQQIEVKESNINTRIDENRGLLEKLTEQLTGSGDDSDIEEEYTKLDFLKNELSRLKDDRSDLNTKLGYYQSIAAMLKDTGIKAMIVQKYLPIFNQLINQYLTKFDFFVKFELDDTFSETILSRHKDNFSYASFSEGEKLRIDLAILLTWREISKMKNAMSTNLLIMDEVFDSSMDQTGVDAFIDLIPKMENANIFVISHTPQKLFDKFKNILEIEKDGNFSVIR